MKAIRTRYIGPTDFKGSRVVASEPDGKRVILSWDDALDADGNHDAAARALIERCGWSECRLASGSLKGGEQVWIMLPLDE